MPGKGTFTRGAKGRFTGSTGGRGFAAAQGAKSLGGLRGLNARARLGKAISKLKAARAEAALVRTEQKGSRGFAKAKASALLRIARAKRAAATHQREVARVEKRGLLRVGALKAVQKAQGLKLSVGERKGIRRDRVFFARERLKALRGEAKTFKRGEVAPAARQRMASRLLAARRSIRNRKRELARLEK